MAAVSLSARSSSWLLRSMLPGNRMVSMAVGCGCRPMTSRVHMATPVIYGVRPLSNLPPKPPEKGDIDTTIEKNLERVRSGDFQPVTHPEDLQHFKTDLHKWKSVTSRPGLETAQTGSQEPPPGTHALPHPIWSEEELHNVEITHKQPKGIVDRLAYMSVKLLRGSFDLISGFNKEPRNEKVWLHRLIFLETVAGVPGMVAAMVRHLHSLRRMRRDHGWIHTLLEEAENERMHLMTALCLKQPGPLFRAGVVGAQGVFVSFFSVAYLLSPRYCHRFVGYLEEEAVVTYSKLLKDMDGGCMQHWNSLPGPPFALTYWKLKPDATMHDVILAIRADEAHHRVVNHTLGSMKPDDYNPYKPGE